MANNSLVVLDVGHGNSAVLIDDHGVLVIDAGPKSYLLEYLDEKKISHVDILLISHADQDHIEGLIALLASDVSIGHVRLNTDPRKDSDLWDNVLYELDHQDRVGKVNLGIELVSESGEALSCGKVKVEVLGPSKYLAGKGPGSTDRNSKKITTNSISAVIKLSINDIGIALFTGDLDEIGLDDLERNHVDLRAITLIYPHHGGRAGSVDMEVFTRRLITTVAPENVVFSIGQVVRGSFKNPRPDVVSAIRNTFPNARILCTQLSKNCVASPAKAEAPYMDKIFSQGLEYGRCCSGSILIDVDSGELLSPSVEEHHVFIEMHTNGPLCR